MSASREAKQSLANPVAELAYNNVPKAKYPGRLVLRDANESHIATCPVCSEQFDRRDLGAVFDHLHPLALPSTD